MRGYEEDEYGYLDEYEEEGEEQEEEEAGEEEYVEEEPQQPSPELLEYLELRQRLKEDLRKQRKKELGSANASSRVIKNALPRDNFGSFFGPSQPVIAQRVIQESKSLLENPNLAAKVMKSSHSSNKSSASKPPGSKTTASSSSHAPKVTNGVKAKIQVVKNTRDYSFLLSDDAELPVPSKRPPPQKVHAPNSDARLVQPPNSKQSSNSNGRKLLNDRDARKPLPGSSQMHPKAVIQKAVSASKPTQPVLDSRKQVGSSNGSGPGQLLLPKGVPPKVPGVLNERKFSTPGVKSSVPALHKPTHSKLQPSVPKQSSVMREPVEYGKPKVRSKQVVPASRPQVIQKQAVASSKPQIMRPPPKSVARPLEDRRPALHKSEDRRPALHQKEDRRPPLQKANRPPVKKPTRYDEEDEDAEAISMIRKMFRYNPNRYRDDDDDSDMEANFDEILKEERRSAKIARKEDEEELRKIEEEERRERLRKAKKRKLNHQ